MKFIQLISEAYFDAYENIENRFVGVVEYFHNEKDIYLTIIDVKNLKHLNVIYGENVINKALKILKTRIETFMKNDYQRTITIKAESANFYMMNIDYSFFEYQLLISELYKVIMSPIEIQGNIVVLPVIIGGILFSKHFDIKDKSVYTSSLTLIKKKAKKEKVDIKIIEFDNELKELLKEKEKEIYILQKIRNKEIEIVFQPIYKTETGEIFSLEVLGRIYDKGDLISIGMYIDKIYELNLIEKFDALILEKLIEKESLIKKVTNKLFINISFQSLLNKEYMKKLRYFLENFEIEVILELTEQKFVSDIELIKSIYNDYKIHFAVDDFGTGYSSLQLVLELKEMGILKILKIDGSLIKGLENKENLKKMVNIISELGKNFKLMTVAEFVENEKILNILKELKIDLSQGYYLSKPLLIEELYKNS
ncbi:MAG: EAL domain-containing protein [Nautiliaceae bacterium]